MKKLVPGIGEKPKRKINKRLVAGVSAIILAFVAACAVVVTLNRHDGPAVKSAAQMADESRVRANDQFASGDASGAAETVQGSIAKTNDTDTKVQSYVQLAGIYSNSNDKDKAIAAAQSAIDLKPDDWKLYKFQGSLYDVFDDRAAAITAYTKADELLKKTSDYNMYHPELQALIKGMDEEDGSAQ